MPIVAGTRISREQTLELAATLARNGSDRTGRMLIDAITLARDFVALTPDDREAILAVLKHPRDELGELRLALFVEASLAIGNLKAGRRTCDEHRGKPNARSRSVSRRGMARGAGDAPGHGEAEQRCRRRPKKAT